MKLKVLIILFLVLAGTALANEFVSRNVTDAKAGTLRDVAVDDSATISQVAATSESVDGCPHVAVSIHFTASGVRTANVTIIRGHGAGTAFVPQSATKAVATSNNRYMDRDGYYLANDITFETQGYSHFIILVDTISSGECVIYRSKY